MVCIAVTFLLRIVTVRFDIRTHAVHEHAIQSLLSSGVKSSVQRLHRRNGGTDIKPGGPDAEAAEADPDLD